MTFTVRRKADGLYLFKSHGSGRVLQFGKTPGKIKTHAKAVALIRVDMGEDLEKFEIEEVDNASKRR